MNSPRREEAKGTGLVRRRGRNRKPRSVLPKLLSAVSLSTGVAVTSRDHPETRRVETNTTGYVRRR